MIEQKRQQVAAIMDDQCFSDPALDQLVNDPEMRSIWSRFHLVRDLIQGEVPQVIDPQLDKRICSAIFNEPELLVPSERREQESKPSGIVVRISNWAEQATSFAIAASVMAIIVFGVQTLNTEITPDRGESAITSLEFLQVDDLQIVHQTANSEVQELLLDITRQSSLYGLQGMTPYVSVVNHSVTVPLTLIKSNFDSILDETETNAEQLKKEESSEGLGSEQ